MRYVIVLIFSDVSKIIGAQARLKMMKTCQQLVLILKSLLKKHVAKKRTLSKMRRKNVPDSKNIGKKPT